MNKVMVGSDGYIDLDEGRVGTAKVKNIQKLPGNYPSGAESFLRVYFDVKNLRKKSEPMVLVSNGEVVAMRGPLNTVLPYQDGKIVCSKEDKEEDEFTTALKIARNHKVTDGKYGLYVLHPQPLRKS